MVKGLASPGAGGGRQDGYAKGLGEAEKAKVWGLLGLRIQIEGV
jgi:hypothetical protein